MEGDFVDTEFYTGFVQEYKPTMARLKADLAELMRPRKQP